MRWRAATIRTGWSNFDFGEVAHHLYGRTLSDLAGFLAETRKSGECEIGTADSRPLPFRLRPATAGQVGAASEWEFGFVS